MIRDLHQNPAHRTLHHHLPTPPSSLHLQVRTSSAQRSNSIDTSYRAKAAKIDPSYRTKAAKLDSSYRTKSTNQESSYRTEAKAARGRSREDIKPSKSVRITLVSISSFKYLKKSMKSRGIHPVPSSKVHPTGYLILPHPEPPAACAKGRRAPTATVLPSGGSALLLFGLAHVMFMWCMLIEW